MTTETPSTPHTPRTPQDAEAILTIATLAALVDGNQDEQEQSRLAAVAQQLGLPNAQRVLASARAGKVSLVVLASAIRDQATRELAYETASNICLANGWLNPAEGAFLRELAAALGVDPTPTEEVVTEINRAISDHAEPAWQATSSLDDHVLDQAMLTAAIELLPDGLANLGILPLQLRLVHHIGRRHGQPLDVNQATDLAATFGIGAAAQVLEKVVRCTFGGLASGLLGGAPGGFFGGAAGGAAGLASGAAITFATTYALGHAADQYYRQGRELSAQDLKALFAKSRTDAETMFPRVEARVRERARGGSLASLLRRT